MTQDPNSEQPQNKSIRWILVGVSLVVSIVLFGAVAIYVIFDVDLTNKVYEDVVDYESLNISVHIRAKTLGIGGSTEISVHEYPYNYHSKVVKADGRSLMIFKGVDAIYYKKKDESSLVLYVASEGALNNSIGPLGKLSIIVNELKNYSELREYESNYEQYGLSKISVYGQE